MFSLIEFSSVNHLVQSLRLNTSHDYPDLDKRKEEREREKKNNNNSVQSIATKKGALGGNTEEKGKVTESRLFVRSKSLGMRNDLS